MDFDFDAMPPPRREQVRWLLVHAAVAQMHGDKETAERLLDEAFFLRNLLRLASAEKVNA